MPFLADDNVCGRTLLKLVARGNAIVAEILRMKDHINVFTSVPSSKSNTEQERFYGVKKSVFESILFDFKYLKAPEKYEEFVTSSEKLIELDEVFHENYISLLERFYLLFEGIFKYASGYNRFVEDLQSGFYIQHSLVGVLLDIDGKQLLTEALYLYGVMLFLIDKYIPGIVRERIVVSYLRYKGEANLLNIDQVILLCRKGEHRVDLFKRFELDLNVVKMIIGRLQSDDIYMSTTVAFPSLEHRSIALSNQASMLYVILHFIPEYMKENRSIMREIADKFFHDNWIITIYMGIWVDLEVEWSSDIKNRSSKSCNHQFPAASSALANTLSTDHVQVLVNYYKSSFAKSQSKLSRYLTKGVLTDNFVLSNVKELLDCLRDANCTLKWFMLHRKAIDPLLLPIINAGTDAHSLVDLLLNIAELEVKMKEILKHLLQEKSNVWKACKDQCAKRMAELSDYFTGEVALTRIERNNTLVEWFAKLRQEILALDFATHNPTFVGRRIQKVINALEDVEQYNAIDTSLQVKEFLRESRSGLVKMVRIVGLECDVLSTLEIVADMSFAWQIINDYQEMIHGRIKKDPQAVNSLRAMFVKLSSVLDIPMVRISQADSSDTLSVAEYYSNELMRYVRKVLVVIPKTVFRILAQIIDLLTERLTPLSSKVEANILQNCAQMEPRYELARMTYLVSVFTKGILSLQDSRTVLGIIEIDPKEILKDGIRQELVSRISQALEEGLQFTIANAGIVEKQLKFLGQKLDAFRLSFEYIQDYINMYGLQLWLQEYSRIVRFNVERECNKYLKRRLVEKHSQFQSKIVPIPIFDRYEVNFMGRAEQILLDLTIPGPTVFAFEYSSWYDEASDLLIGLSFWQTLKSALGIVGLHGLEKLLSFRLCSCLHEIYKVYCSKIVHIQQLLHEVHGELDSLSDLPKDKLNFFNSASRKSHRIIQNLIPLLLQIGQIQLLRKQLLYTITAGFQTESSQIFSATRTVNHAAIERLQERNMANEYLRQVSSFTNYAGIAAPTETVFVRMNSADRIAELLILVTVAGVHRLSFDESLSALRRPSPKEPPVDGAPLAMGIYTLLKQCDPSHIKRYLIYVSKLLKCSLWDEEAKYDHASLLSKKITCFVRDLHSAGRLSTIYKHSFVSKGISI